ncbi:MAG: hypothetical protein ACRDND_00390 [Streptosporangiaceae bacterium]
MVVRGDHGSTPQLGLRISGAVLLAVSAGIHLDLYLTGYRKIPTIGWLFLLQVIVGFMLTIAALVTRSRLAAAASAALALSTLAAYLLAVWIGLFGFKEIRTRAGLAAGLIEVAAFATLALAAVTASSGRHAAGRAGASASASASAPAGSSASVFAAAGSSASLFAPTPPLPPARLPACSPAPPPTRATGHGRGSRAPCRWWSPRSALSRWPPWPCSASR